MAAPANRPTYESKLCPLLTGATYTKAEMPKVQSIAGPRNPQDIAGAFSPVTCKGHACMWFIAATDEHGKPTGDGVCAVNAQFQGLQQVGAILLRDKTDG